MEKQMDTVNGAFSNAGDAIDNLAVALGESGLNSVVKTLTLTFSGLVNAMASFINPNAQEQMTSIAEKMQVINDRISDRLAKGHAVNQEIAQVKALGAEYAALAKTQEANKGGIDEAGKGGAEKRAAEIAASQAQDQTLYENAENAHNLRIALALQSKQTEIDGLAALQMTADEQMIVSQQIIADQSLAKAQADSEMRLGVVNMTLGNLAILTASSSKKLFKIGKASGIASALVNTYQAVTKTMAATPYPWNIPLAAAQGLAGLVQVQNIKSQQFSGQAHDGMDRATEGSYKLKRDEMVLDSGTSAKVRKNIDNATVGGNTIIFNPVIQAFDANEVMRNKDKLFEGMRNMFVNWMNEEGLGFTQ